MMRILIAIILFATPVAHAQLFERELTLTMSPQYPAPGDTVTLSVSTQALDLDRSEIVWFADEKEIARGFGLTQTSVTFGAEGESTDIVVVAEDDTGLLARAATSIRPSEVDFLWEATSYVPPFYEGRTLPGTSGTIRAQAIARFRASDGSLVPEQDIVYTWYRNGSIAASGRGKARVALPAPSPFSTDVIRVTAISADNAYSGSASARIPAVDPFLVFYEDHPLFGVLYHRALEGSVNTLETELEVSAVPYFANVASPADPALTYEWKVGNALIQADPDAPQILSLAANGYRGSLPVSLTLMSLTDVAMRAVGGWELVFGAQDSGFFSGRSPFGTTEE